MPSCAYVSTRTRWEFDTGAAREAVRSVINTSAFCRVHRPAAAPRGSIETIGCASDFAPAVPLPSAVPPPLCGGAELVEEPVRPSSHRSRPTGCARSATAAAPRSRVAGHGSRRARGFHGVERRSPPGRSHTGPPDQSSHSGSCARARDSGGVLPHEHGGRLTGRYATISWNLRLWGMKRESCACRGLTGVLVGSPQPVLISELSGLCVRRPERGGSVLQRAKPCGLEHERVLPGDRFNRDHSARQSAGSARQTIES